MNKFLEKNFPLLIDSIYASALEPELWKNTLRQFSDVFDGAICSLFVSELQENVPAFLVEWGMDNQATLNYANYYDKLNPYPVKAFSKRSAGQPMCALDCLTQEESISTEFYNDWMRPNMWKPDHFGGLLFNDVERLGLIAISPQNKDSMEKLPQNFSYFSLLLPHIIRAIEINRNLANNWNNVNTLEQFLEGIESSAFLIQGYKNRVIFQNTSAKNLVAQSGCIQLDKAGQLYCLHSSSNSLLQKALYSSCYDINTEPTPLTLKLYSYSQEKEYIAWLYPCNSMHSIDISSRAHLLNKLAPNANRILIIRELSSVINISADVIRNVLNLTSAEANIVSALAKGHTLFDYADVADVSRHTVRKQLSHIFRKLNINTQQELIILISNLHL